MSRPPPNNNDLLLDIDDYNKGYNPGRPPIDDDVRRQSESYDEFIGAGGGPAYPPAHRTQSQASGLGTYQPYYDNDYPEEGPSYAAGRDDGPDLMGSPQGHRQSTYSMSGVVGRVKSFIGQRPAEYSEMDLPLRETRAQDTIAGAGGDGESVSGGAGGKKRKPFRFGFGNKVDPSTLGPRIIHLNNPPANATSKFKSNYVSTTKYNAFTFLPKFLLEQFSKAANVFFLFTALLQQIPNISPTNRYTTIAPLIVVLMVSAGKEALEDWKRRQSDRELNNSKARVLVGSTFEDKKWVEVNVGDIVRVESEEPFPADIVLMASSEPEGLCYIETANLDGETNLKIKQAIPETANFVSTHELSRLSGRVKSEQPNSSLYTYEATLTVETGGGEKEFPLSPEQLLLRGAVLRNTPWIHGVVVFTGHESKLMRNATATPIKTTAVERMLNVQILMLVAILLGLSLISSVGDVIKRVVDKEHLSYLHLTDSNKARQFFSDILTYWVLYSNLVPIS